MSLETRNGGDFISEYVKNPKAASLRPFKMIILPISTGQSFRNNTRISMIIEYLQNREVPCYSSYDFVRLENLHSFYFGKKPLYPEKLPRVCILFFDQKTYGDPKIIVREVRQMAPDMHKGNILFLFILEEKFIDLIMEDGTIGYSIFIDPSIADQQDSGAKSSWLASYLFKLSQLLGLNKDLKTAHLKAIAENFADTTLEKRPRLIISTTIDENSIYPG